MQNVRKLILPVLLAAGVTVLLADVTTDYDHHVDFGRYHTYSWIGVKAGNQLWQQRIEAAVDNELSAKGWSKVNSGGDAAVSAFGRTREQDTLQTFYDGFPGWRWGGFGESTTYNEPSTVGTLTVDIFDGQSKNLIWRGKATDTLSSQPDKNTKTCSRSSRRKKGRCFGFEEVYPPWGGMPPAADWKSACARRYRRLKEAEHPAPRRYSYRISSISRCNSRACRRRRTMP